MKGFRTILVERDGLPLALHVQEGEGPIAFFQHGLCGDAAQPASVFPADARLAVLDCRGHGETPAGPVDALSIATFANDVLAAMAAVCDGPVILGGISMGAAIAMRIACLAPERVSRLIIARPAWMTESAPVNMAPNLEVGLMLKQPAAQEQADVFLASATGRMLAAESPDNLASLSGFFRREPRAVTAELLTRISRDGPGVNEAQLSALSVPTLVIGHGDDVVHPMAHARQLAALIPDARLVQIPPKTRGREAYEAGFRIALRRFIQETHHATS